MFSRLKARETAYDDGRLWLQEVARDHERQARVAFLKSLLVDGPVLVLPLHHPAYQFSPQTLMPLDALGTVYPTIRLESDWGVLDVESGGALLDKDMKTAAVSAVGFKPATLEGEGWRLTLKKGWAVAPGVRKGDLIVGDEARDAH
jgi:hypothetical protein